MKITFPNKRHQPADLLNYLNKVRYHYRQLNDEIPFVTLFRYLNQVEWTLRFDACLLFACVQQDRDFADHSDAAILLRQFNHRRLSLGNWATILKEVTGFVVREVNLPDATLKLLKRMDKMLHSSEFVNLRNHLIGHGLWDPTQAAYLDVLSPVDTLLACLDDVAEALVLSSEFELYPFILVGGESIESGSHIPQFYVLVGVDLSGERTADYTEVLSRHFHKQSFQLNDEAGVLERIHRTEPPVALARLLKEWRERLRVTMVTAEPFLQPVRSFLAAGDKDVLLLTAQGGVGKTVAALFMEEALSEQQVVTLPLSDALASSKAVVQSEIARATFMRSDQGWQEFLEELSRGSRQLLIVLDGLDELPEGGGKALVELLNYVHGVRWIITSRPLSGVDNHLAHWLKKSKRVTTVEVSSKKPEYQAMVDTYLGADESTMLRQTQPTPTMLQAYEHRCLEGRTFDELIEDDNNLANALALMALLKVPCSIWELVVLVTKDETWQNWSSLRGGLERVGFMLRRKGLRYSFVHLNWAERCAKLGPKVVQQVGNHLQKYLERRSMDLRVVDKLRGWWVDGLGPMLLLMEKQEQCRDELRSLVLPECSKDSVLWRLEELIRELPPERKSITYTQYFRLVRTFVEGYHQKHVQVADHLLVLTNCGERNVEWEAHHELMQIARRDPQFIEHLIQCHIDFEDRFGVIERLRPKSSIRSSLSAILCDVVEQIKDREPLADVLIKVIEGKLSPWLKRHAELLAELGDQRTAEVLLHTWRWAKESDGGDAFLARSIVEQMGRDPELRNSLVALQEDLQTVAKRPIPDNGPTMAHILAVRELLGDATKSDLQRLNTYRLRSNDWRDCKVALEWAMSKEEAANVVFDEIDKNIGFGPKLLRHRDAPVRRALYDFLLTFRELSRRRGGSLRQGLRSRIERFNTEGIEQDDSGDFPGGEADYLCKVANILECKC